MEDRIENINKKVSLQVEILVDLYGGSNKLSFLFYLCFDEGEEKFNKKQRLDLFNQVKMKMSCEQEEQKSIEFEFVEFTRAKNSKDDENCHQFLSSSKIKENIRNRILQNQSTGIYSFNPKHAPQEKAFHFKIPPFKSIDGSLSVCLHDTNSLAEFYDNYLSESSSKLITIPDFDRIESTKLYPKSSSSNAKHYECPGLHPGRELNSHIGEFDRFWPHFKVWFPNTKGVLMHSYSQDQLLPLLENENIFSFEFDWMYWSANKVLLFEVSMGKKIGPKLKQVFERHFTVLRILLHFFSTLTSKKYEEFFSKLFAFVIFCADINHEQLQDQVESAIKGSKKYWSNYQILDSLYFVGNTNCQSKTNPFWKFDPIDRKTGKKTSSGKIVSCKMEFLSLTETEREFLKSLACLFSIGYFTKQNIEVLQPSLQTQDSLRSRFIKCQQKYLNKFLKTRDMNAHTSTFLDKLDVILSPQQFRIILDDPKILLCTAEAGSGKTQLLLAKALQGALDEDVDTVYFCIPEPPDPKNEGDWKRKDLEEIVMDFFKRNKNDFGSKFHMLSDGKLSNLLLKKPVAELKRTVLLIDEFHYGYESSFKISRSDFRNLALKTFPYLKTCWLANVTLHYRSETDLKLSDFVPRELLCMRPLNVHYRSAQHISQFCSKLVQFNRKGKFSSPRIHGIFLSEVQHSVELRKFSKESTINNSKEGVLSLNELNTSSVMCTKYEFSRWVIVICYSKDQKDWESVLLNKFGYKKDQLKIFCIEDGFPSCYCSGGEATSVLLFIDGPFDDDYVNSVNKYNDMFQVACSRAQFELVILISHKMSKVFEKLSACGYSSDNPAPRFIKMDDNVAIDYFLKVAESKIPDEKDITTLVEHCNTTCNPFLSREVDDDILIVVLCEKDQQECWTNFILSEEFNYRSKYVFSLDDYVESRLTSDEFSSVLFFIDSPNKPVFTEKRMFVSNILRKVLSRATKRLLVYVRDDLKHISVFLASSNSPKNDIHIENYTLASFSKISSFKTPGVYILFFYCKALRQNDVLSKVNELVPFLQGSVNREILLLLGVKYSLIMKTLMGVDKSSEAPRMFTGWFCFFPI